MAIVVSGVRPTGKIHLGNYFGAIRNFVRMQEENTCYFFIADYHSLTTHPSPSALRDNVDHILAHYLACGIDPQKAVLYTQSDLPQTAELYLYINMNAYLGELSRCTSFKEKARQNPNNINIGLLSYPSLMAADILIHHADFVPVGKDQEQHLEMTRIFASRFNGMYQTQYFKEPKAYNFGNELVKVPGLDGKGKMGKSEGEMNAVYLSDTDEVIRKKIMKAVSDSGPTVENQEKPESIQHLFKLMEILSPKETYEHFDSLYKKCQIRYGDMKKALAEDCIRYVSPIREKILYYLENKEVLNKVRKEGGERALESGRKTLREVREIIGI